MGGMAGTGPLSGERGILFGFIGNIILLIPLLTTYETKASRPPAPKVTRVSWAEEYYGVGNRHNDLFIFFDRAVFVATGENEPIAPGVFITHNTILTSYNPYRKLQREKKPLSVLKVIVLLERNFTNKDVENEHKKALLDIQCARQVVPIPEKDLTSKEWHGTTKKHSPLHDLMVLRLASNNLKFLDPNPRVHTFETYTAGENKFHVAGPIVTRLATSSAEYRTDTLTFASLGFRSKEHIAQGLALSSRRVKASQVADCDEWIPREWGYFICIINIDHFEGVGSGALLISFHDFLVYGIGSFVLKKGKSGILVFTDVRPYIDIIFKTCSKKSDVETKANYTIAGWH